MNQMKEMIRRAQQGDKEARERLVMENTPLVWSMVNRFAYSGREKEELFQIGVIGLMQAVDRFDTSYDVKFSTYAVPLIIGEIRRFLRDDTPVKVARSIVENRRRIHALMEQQEHLTIEDIVKETELTMEDVMLALGSERPVESIYEPVYDSGEGEVLLIDQLQKTGKPMEQEVMEHQMLQQAFAQLDETETKVIRLRYFENKTQSQIGEMMEMTQVQLFRLEKKILLKMRSVFL